MSPTRVPVLIHRNKSTHTSTTLSTIGPAIPSLRRDRFVNFNHDLPSSDTRLFSSFTTAACGPHIIKRPVAMSFLSDSSSRCSQRFLVSTGPSPPKTHLLGYSFLPVILVDFGPAVSTIHPLDPARSFHNDHRKRIAARRSSTGSCYTAP